MGPESEFTQGISDAVFTAQTQYLIGYGIAKLELCTQLYFQLSGCSPSGSASSKFIVWQHKSDLLRCRLS